MELNTAYLLHFCGGIPDHRLIGKLNPDKTFSTLPPSPD